MRRPKKYSWTCCRWLFSKGIRHLNRNEKARPSLTRMTFRTYISIDCVPFSASFFRFYKDLDRIASTVLWFLVNYSSAIVAFENANKPIGTNIEIVSDESRKSATQEMSSRANVHSWRVVVSWRNRVLLRYRRLRDTQSKRKHFKTHFISINWSRLSLVHLSRSIFYWFFSARYLCFHARTKKRVEMKRVLILRHSFAPASSWACHGF